MQHPSKRLRLSRDGSYRRLAELSRRELKNEELSQRDVPASEPGPDNARKIAPRQEVVEVIEVVTTVAVVANPVVETVVVSVGLDEAGRTTAIATITPTPDIPQPPPAPIDVNDPAIPIPPPEAVPIVDVPSTPIPDPNVDTTPLPEATESPSVDAQQAPPPEAPLTLLPEPPVDPSAVPSELLPSNDPVTDSLISSIIESSSLTTLSITSNSSTRAHASATPPSFLINFNRTLSPTRSSHRSTKLSAFDSASSTLGASDATETGFLGVAGSGGGGPGANGGPGGPGGGGDASDEGSDAPVAAPVLVGGVVGGLAGLAFLLLIALLVLRWYRRKGNGIQLPDTDTREISHRTSRRSGLEAVLPASMLRLGPHAGMAPLHEPEEKSFHKVTGRKLPSAFAGPEPSLPDIEKMGVAGLSLAASGATVRDWEQKEMGLSPNPSPRPGHESTFTASSYYPGDRDSRATAASYPSGTGVLAPAPLSLAPALPRDSTMSAGPIEPRDLSRESALGTLMPSPARTPTVHHQPSGHGFFPVTETPVPPMPSGDSRLGTTSSVGSTLRMQNSRGTLGRSRPSHDSSRGSRFTEDV